MTIPTTTTFIHPTISTTMVTICIYITTTTYLTLSQLTPQSTLQTTLMQLPTSPLHSMPLWPPTLRHNHINNLCHYQSKYHFNHLRHNHNHHLSNYLRYNQSHHHCNQLRHQSRHHYSNHLCQHQRNMKLQPGKAIIYNRYFFYNLTIKTV